MLRFVTGGIHSNRDENFCQLIKKSCECNENVMVIIPDQFSFEYDKKLYNLLGAKAFNDVSIVGFNRLAELISRKYGAGSKENANENAKIITMYKAVKRLKETHDVRFYERSLNKGAFLGEVIALISELIQSGITYQDLRIASESLDGSVSSKLFDLSRLYEYYLDELARAGLKDTLTSLGECVKLVKENNFFKGKTVYIDAFNSFSQDEYRLIECAIKQANPVVISLVISDSNNAQISRTPFAQTIRTRSNIEGIAMAQNVSFDEKAFAGFNYTVPSIAYVNENIYTSMPKKSADNHGVKLLSATDIYEEVEFVCSEISRLVREENYAYEDIAVSSRNLGDIAPVIEGTFERYEIPYFLDANNSVEQSALVIYLKNIFACVLSKEYKTENLLKYIKSPLCSIFDYDIADIENYCVKWNIQGNMWLEDFTAGEKSGSVPTRLNQTRELVIAPLEKFKSACVNATAQDICKALYILLDEIGLSKEIYSVVKMASGSANDTELELGRISKQIWKTVLAAVQSIYENMGDEVLTLRRFYEIFKMMISQMKVSAPPQKIDSVRCACAERSRLNDVKVLFVLEANDGIFPADFKSKGLLTEREKRQLESVDINLNTTVMSSIENERLTVYQTVSMPNDRLYIISSESDTQGKKKNPSVLVNMIFDMFEHIEIEKIQDKPLDFFCTSYATAYYKYLEKSKDKTSEVKSIKESLLLSDKYRQKLDFIEQTAVNKPHKLSRDCARDVFFNHDLNISATRVSDFYNCPFSFFCKYGLKLHAPEKVEINNRFFGNLMHNTLEKVMSKVNDNGIRVYDEKFVDFDEQTLRDKINAEFSRYIADEMGGDFGKTLRFKQGIARNEESAFSIIKVVQEEFKKSAFKPAAFEFNLAKSDGESILKLTLEDGYTINIYGSIDRADIFEDENGVRYLRIVDYKTGDTKFDIEDIYNGLNLQMFIYLYAVINTDNRLNYDGKLEPSGIMYSHIKSCHADFTPSAVEKADDLQGKMFLEQIKNCKPDGMMIENEDTLDALNNDYKGLFTLFTRKNNGDITEGSKPPCDYTYFNALSEFAFKKIELLAQRLLEGDIAADPICKGDGRNAKIACRYCDFWSICGNASPKNPRRVNKSDKHLLDAEIDKMCDETNDVGNNE